MRIEVTSRSSFVVQIKRVLIRGGYKELIDAMRAHPMAEEFRLYYVSQHRGMILLHPVASGRQAIADLFTQFEAAGLVRVIVPTEECGW